MSLETLFWWCLIGGGVGAIVGKHFRAQPLAGGGLGVIFGPLGWLLIYTIKDVREKCSECLSPVPEGASRCARCGAEL